MLKKIIALVSLVLIFSGCDVINVNTPHKEVVDMAFNTKIGKPNMSGYGYTYTATRNSQIKNDSVFSRIVSVGNNKYSIYVNIAQYLEDENLVTKTANGDYISTKNTKQKTSSNDKNYLYTYRHIFIADNSSLTVEENYNNARKTFDELMGTQDPSKSFVAYAIKFSDEISTSTSGGIIGPVKSSEINEKTLEALDTLDNESVYNDIIAVDGGYDIVMLVSKVVEKKEIDEASKDNTEDVMFSSTNGDYKTYVIDNSNDTYSVVTQTKYISVSTLVNKQDINDALYATVTTARSIKINKDVALNSLINPSYDTKSTELFDLNKSNSGVVSQIEKKYDTKFSTSLSETANNQVVVGGKDITFDTQKITQEEYDKIKEKQKK